MCEEDTFSVDRYDVLIDGIGESAVAKTAIDLRYSGRDPADGDAF